MLEDGVWRTIGGRRVFIKKGQSLSGAMKESGKFNFVNKKMKLVDNKEETKIEDKYKNAELKADEKGKCELYNNGEEIKMLPKKEYDELATKFADSLNEQEIKMLQDYVDAPGLSGELNAWDETAPDKQIGSGYLYNTTNEDYYITQNELNKYYSDMAEKFNKDIKGEKNLFWPDDEVKEWVKDQIGTDDYRARDMFLKEISLRQDNKWSSNEQYKYHTPEQIARIRTACEKSNELRDLQAQYFGQDKYWELPEYKKLSEQIKEVETIDGVEYGWFDLQRISESDTERVFNSTKYNFDELLKEGKLKYLKSKQIKDMKDIGKYQSSQFVLQKNRITNMMKDYNELFDKKGVTLDRDILVFRRGRESTDEINAKSFKRDGVISTTVNDSLPKKMPSGNPFGDVKEYIVVPKGTKVVFTEKVIGRGYENRPNYEDVLKGVRKQHEILLRPGTEFKVISSAHTPGKYEDQSFALVAIDGGGQ